MGCLLLNLSLLIERTVIMPESAGSPLFLESGSNGVAVKISGAEKPAPDYHINSPRHQCSTSNPVSGHLVYVRRKAEAESGTSTGCDRQNDRPDGSQAGKLSNHKKTSQHKDELKEAFTRDSTAGLSSTKPSVSSSLPKTCDNSTPSNTLRHITSTNSLLADPKSVDLQHLDVRYFHLQNFLIELDHSNRDEYIQMLRSLSSVELSRHAVELEKRSIQLSLEEGKELQRVRVLDVLRRYS